MFRITIEIPNEMMISRVILIRRDVIFCKICLTREHTHVYTYVRKFVTPYHAQLTSIHTCTQTHTRTHTHTYIHTYPQNRHEYIH